MATSGSAMSSFTDSRFQLGVEWSRTNVDVANNYSTVNVKVYLHVGASINANGRTLNINIDGQNFSMTSNRLQGENGAKVFLGEATKNIYHNTDGTKSFSYSASMTIGSLSGLGNVGSANTTGTGVLDTIPRTSMLSAPPEWKLFNYMPVNIKTASGTFSHKLDIYVGGIHLKTVNSIGINDVVGFTLDEHTTILQRINANNKISATVSVKVTTYTSGGTYIGEHTTHGGIVYAPNSNYLSGQPSSFYIGNFIESNITKGWNSANMTTTIQLVIGGSTFTLADKTSATSWGYNTNAIASSLYSILGSDTSKSGYLRVYSYYNNVQIGTYSQYSITMKLSDGYPSFSSSGIYYADTNTETISITGDSSVIIQGKSNLRITIPSSSRAIAQNGATMTKYDFIIGGITKSVNYTTSTINFDFGIVNLSSNAVLSIRAVDSRGLYTTVNINVTIVPYYNPVLIPFASRVNGFEETTKINGIGSISPIIVGGSQKNGIQTLEYRYKESTTSSFPSVDRTAELFTSAPLLTEEVFNYTIPFNTTYHDNRFEFIITRDDMISAGFSSGSISSLQVYIDSVSPININNFRVAMKSTSKTQLSQSFDDAYSTFTEVYIGTLSGLSTGWITISFDSNFYWNGVSNIIVHMSSDKTEWQYGGSIHGRELGKANIARGFIMDGGTFPFEGNTSTIYGFTKVPRLRLTARGGSWSSLGYSSSGAGFTVQEATLTLDNLKSYDFEFRVKDKLGITTIGRQVPVGKPILFIDSEKKSVGVNKFPIYNNAFEVEDSIYASTDIVAGRGMGADNYVIAPTDSLPIIVNKDGGMKISKGIYYLNINPENNTRTTINTSANRIDFNKQIQSPSLVTDSINLNGSILHMLTNGVKAININFGNANSLTDSGFYYVYQCSNTPFGNDYGYIITIQGYDSSYVIQFGIRETSIDRVYRREMIGGTWSAWIGGTRTEYIEANGTRQSNTSQMVFSGSFSKAFPSTPAMMYGGITVTPFSYIDAMREPYFYNVTASSFTCRLTTFDGSPFGATSARARFIAIG